MTETPADEYRQAAAELRDVAPLIDGPLAGLADPVADWLDQAAKHHEATVIGAASVWQRPDEAAYRDAFVTKHTDRAALAVARQVLGTTTGQPETEAHRPCTEWIAEVREDDGLWMYLGSDPDRTVAEKRCASMTRRHPDAPTRIVRKTTTYTVKQLADEAQQPTPAVAETAPIVAYRDPNNPRVLLCREHGEQWQGVVPVTSEDLPDGGICTFGRLSSLTCGRDVLIPAPAEETK
ncbi:hypothetical protein AB0I87_18590 [Streptomyces sp. NPDC049952]|uniref:hypothetical protein n=1 Tax=Streptomyces sp. NPDC049952 TaxID=3156665 RepID=UPI00341F0B3B